MHRKWFQAEKCLIPWFDEQPIDQMLEVTEGHKTQQLREYRLAAIHDIASFAEETATIRRKNRSRFQIVGIRNHAKTRVIIGLHQVRSKTTGQMWSSGATESDHAWHEFFALRPVEENDLIEGVPWGTAGALFDAIANATPWNELLSPHWEVACR
jgi:hypothetical protein